MKEFHAHSCFVSRKPSLLALVPLWLHLSEHSQYDDSDSKCRYVNQGENDILYIISFSLQLLRKIPLFKGKNQWSGYYYIDKSITQELHWSQGHLQSQQIHFWKSHLNLFIRNKMMWCWKLFIRRLLTSWGSFN